MPAGLSGLFTSATQVEHLFRVAEETGQDASLRNVLESWTLVASIGPITTATLRQRDVEPDLQPEHARMGCLVVEVAERAAELLERKRRARGHRPPEVPLTP